jgi:hypothetical protein
MRWNYKDIVRWAVSRALVGSGEEPCLSVVADRVRRYRTAGECRAAHRGADNRKIQALPDVRTRQPFSIPVWKHKNVRPGITQSLYPVAKQHGGGFPKRHASLFASFPLEMNGRRAIGGDDVPIAQTDCFRHPGARVVHDVEQSPVATAGPGGGIGRFEDRPHLLARQKAEHRSLEPLHRNGQRLLDDGECGEVVMCGVFQERSQGRQPGVAAAHGVFRSFSRWSRNARISVASRSVITIAVGVLPIFASTNPAEAGMCPDRRRWCGD